MATQESPGVKEINRETSTAHIGPKQILSSQEQENLRLVYLEANLNRRHYSSLRFAMQSVFYAALGALAMVAFQVVEIKSPSPGRIVTGAKIGGLILTVIFFWFEIIGDLHLRHFSDVATHLETDLGYQQLSNRNFRRYLPPAFYFGCAIYISLIVMWLGAILWRS